MARESKAELTDRLKSEGRWDEFKKRREALKAQGIPAREARVQATMEFPPMAQSLPKAPWPIATRRQLQSLKRKPSKGIMKAAEWVLENLDCDWVRPRDAPSIEAWSLLGWARQSAATRADFFRIYGSKLLAFQGKPKPVDPLKECEHEMGLDELLGGIQGRSDGTTR